jgi:hypothetical protein
MIIKLFLLFFISVSINVFSFAQESDINNSKDEYKDIIKCIVEMEHKQNMEFGFNLLLLDSTCIPTGSRITHNDSINNYFNINANNFRILDTIRENIDIHFKHRIKLEEDIINISSMHLFSADSITKLYELTYDSLDFEMLEFWNYINDSIGYDGYCQFSNPYIYKENTAFVYYYSVFGALSGSGWLFFLVKENNKWRIMSKIFQWIS